MRNDNTAIFVMFVLRKMKAVNKMFIKRHFYWTCDVENSLFGMEGTDVVHCVTVGMTSVNKEISSDEYNVKLFPPKRLLFL
jgi:hypothetical protein